MIPVEVQGTFALACALAYIGASFWMRPMTRLGERHAKRRAEKADRAS